MQNITDEKIKADAARLGFHKRPMGDLIKLIEASVQDEVQKIETKLKIRKEKIFKKLEALRKKSEDIKNKVGETKIIPETILMAISGVFIVSILYYIGSLEDIVTALLFVGIGIVGAVIVYIKPMDSDFWKPILFSVLSLLIVVMQVFLAYDKGYGFGQALVFSIPLGIMTYLLNEIFFNSAFALMNQSLAIWHRIHLTTNRFRRFFNHKLFVNAEKRLEALSKKKELMIQKSVNIISYEYCVADLASDLKKKDLSIKHVQLNGKEHNYAN